jgi:hypothetical protein
MRIVSVIADPSEVSKILQCLKINHAPPFNKVATKASCSASFSESQDMIISPGEVCSL